MPIDVPHLYEPHAHVALRDARRPRVAGPRVASRHAVLAASAGACFSDRRVPRSARNRRRPHERGGDRRSTSTTSRRSSHAPSVTSPTSLSMPISAADLIRQFDLQPHPEGGYFRETYRATDSVVRPADGAPRAASTACCATARIRRGTGSVPTKSGISMRATRSKCGCSTSATVSRSIGSAIRSRIRAHRVPGRRAGRPLVRRALRIGRACRARRLHGRAGFRVRGIRARGRRRAGRRLSGIRGTHRGARAAFGTVTLRAVERAAAGGDSGTLRAASAKPV